jgi:hypothetical protein
MLMKYLCRLLCLFACLHVQHASAADNAASACAGDLEEIAAFLPLNDSGAAAAIADHGARIDAALLRARADAGQATDKATCDAFLKTYLRTWRRGHLVLGNWPWKAGMPMNGSAAAALSSQADTRAPAFQVLGKQTVLLRLGSFGERYQSAIETLLTAHRAELAAHPYWIIDVRNNDGGSDSAYGALLPWLMDSEYVSHNVEWLVTPANLQAQEEICSTMNDAASCVASVAPVLQAMRGAAPASYVLARGESAQQRMPLKKGEAHAPSLVAVLVGRGCASSCEEFLLTVRQSARVKLLGAPSAGMLDYSNLRSHPLPSGQRAVFYATSRSSRLPAMPIDRGGVQPDIFLPRSSNDGVSGGESDVELSQAQHWLERQSLRRQ